MGREFVFVFGVIHRSGSNFLHRLISMHPDVASVETVLEDNITSYLGDLETFTNRVVHSWNRELWDPNGEVANRFNYHMAKGCLEFLREQADAFDAKSKRFILTKSPTCKNILNFDMFPHSKAVVVVRDGRATIESGMRSFGWYFEEAVFNWKRHAQELVEAAKHNPNIMIVRYENLVVDTQAAMAPVLEFLGLSAEEYPWSELNTVPVIGSSDTRERDGELHWRDTQKYSDFNPLERADNWCDEQVQIYSRIAGTVAENLGYTSKGMNA